MEPRKVERIGVIGFGFAGQLHAQVLRESFSPETILIHDGMTNSRDRHLLGFRAEVNTFIDSFINGKPSPVPLTYACKLQQLLDQIYDRSR